MFEALERLGLPYTVVRVFPYVDKIVKLEDCPPLGVPFTVDELPEYDSAPTNSFVFGSLKLARIGRDRGWNPGSLMNPNHDFDVYKDHYRENLLNYDSKIQTLGDKIEWLPGEIKFIRPTEDTKSFTGQLFNEYEWKDTLENYLHNYRSAHFNESTKIQVSTPKTIFKEIRFWVVDGKIITGSQYRLGRSVIYDDRFEPEAQDFAQSMVDKFPLAEAFVIDVCLTPDGWRIVEAGCINCAGFYKSDLQKTIMAIEDMFGWPKRTSRKEYYPPIPPPPLTQA